MIRIVGISLLIFIVEFLFLSKTCQKKPHKSKLLFLVGHFLTWHFISKIFLKQNTFKRGKEWEEEKEGKNKETRKEK